MLRCGNVPARGRAVNAAGRSEPGEGNENGAPRGALSAMASG